MFRQSSNTASVDRASFSKRDVPLRRKLVQISVTRHGFRVCRCLSLVLSHRVTFAYTAIVHGTHLFAVYALWSVNCGSFSLPSLLGGCVQLMSFQMRIKETVLPTISVHKVYPKMPFCCAALFTNDPVRLSGEIIDVATWQH